MNEMPAAIGRVRTAGSGQCRTVWPTIGHRSQKRAKLSVTAAVTLTALSVAVAQAGGQESYYVARTGPIDAASLETSSFELCDRVHPFDYRRVRLYFANAIEKQDAGVARLAEKYTALNRRGVRAPVKGRKDERMRWRQEIADDAWDLRFMIEAFVPFEHYPRAIHSWPDKLASKRPTAERDAGQLAQVKIAFLQHMFDGSPGSNDSAALYIDEVAILWSMSSPADPGSGTETPALKDLLAQWQMVRASYPALKAAIDQTLEDPALERAIWSDISSWCRGG